MRDSIFYVQKELVDSDMTHQLKFREIHIPLVIKIMRLFLISILLSPTFAFQVPYSAAKKRYNLHRESFYLHFSPESEYSTEMLGQNWIQLKDMQRIANQNGSDLDLFSAIHADVAYYDRQSSNPAFYRLRKSNDDSSMLIGFQNSYMKQSDIPNRVNDAIHQTIRWCLNFVLELNLCPWAKLSLKDKMAIRLKVIDQESGIDRFEQIIRESAKELIKITDEGYVDENVVITFIVALPKDEENWYDFEFDKFYDFSVDLEDRLFEEAEESNDNSDVPIGDEITIAPFHPDWAFASDSGNIKLEAVDFEKKSPFPTISLVKSLVIERAGEESTIRIGQNNKMILEKHGVEWLKSFYQENVTQDGRYL